jgi:hypothetical protein
MMNTPAQIATGRKLLARYGSWDAVRAASILRNGVWLVMPADRGRLSALAARIRPHVATTKE